tara:strand:- start:9 stop:149 length:141 start_codon:yes stop_codon:yes gene_type:complete
MSRKEKRKFYRNAGPRTFLPPNIPTNPVRTDNAELTAVSCGAKSLP